VCTEKKAVQIFAVLQKALVTLTMLLLSSDTKENACWSNQIQYLVSHVLKSGGERRCSQ
jgi:hypothetical protein